MEISARTANFGGGVFTGCAPSKSTGSKASPFNFLVLLLFVIPFCFGCIGATSGPKSASGAPAAQISVLPGSVSFGSVAIGSTSSQSITITNESESSVTITQANTKAGGISIKGMTLPLVIGAGKRAMFEIVYKPKKAGVLTGNISILSNRSSKPSLVSVRGIGMATTALLTSSASNLKFGKVELGESDALSVTLTNAGNSEVRVSNVIVQGASYSASGVSAGLILAPGQSATLDARFLPKTAGTSNGSVIVASNATNSPTTISFSGDGAQTGSHSVRLTWSPSPSRVAGYNVYRSESSAGPYAKLDTIFAGTDDYVDAGVQAGLTYYYVITSINFDGLESADSRQASATIPTP